MHKTIRICLLTAAAALLFSGCDDGKKSAPQPKPAISGDGFSDTPAAVSQTPSAPAPDSKFSDLRFGSSGSDGKIEVETGNDTPAVDVQTSHIHYMTPADAAVAAKITVGRKSTWQLRTETPADSLAARLTRTAKDGKVIVWTPMKAPVAMSPVRLPDMKISPDSSVIAFVETTGKSEGPFGSRLVLMNTHTWSVIRIVEVPGRNIKQITWIPGTVSVGALCSAQKSMRQEEGLAVIDLRKGKETGFIPVPPGTGRTAFLADKKGNLILSHPEKAELMLIPADDLSAEKQRSIPTEAPDAAAAISPDGRYLASAAVNGANVIRIFKTSDWQPLDTVKLAEPVRLKQIFFLKNGIRDFFLTGTPEGAGTSSVMVQAGVCRTLDGWASGFGAVDAGTGTVINVLRERNMISVLDAASGAERHRIDTNRADPGLDNNGVIAGFCLVPAVKGMAALDSQGNFFLIPTEKGKGRRSERAIVFTCRD